MRSTSFFAARGLRVSVLAVLTALVLAGPVAAPAGAHELGAASASPPGDPSAARRSVIVRYDGADRYDQSAVVSSKFAAGVSTAYIASGELFPDALSASAAAGAEGGPVLLVAKDSISPAVGAELYRLKPKSIVLLGGTNTISVAVETALHGYAAAVTRIGGADRYAVSANVSAAAFTRARPVVYVASGEVFPDALAGSAAAGAQGGPLLLVSRDQVPTAVATELGRLSPATIVVLGGADTVTDAVMTALNSLAPTTRIGGADRYAVAAGVAATAFPGTARATAYIASGENFPDALSGAALAIRDHAPMLLLTRDGVPEATAAELRRRHPGEIVALGGPNSISTKTFTSLAGY